MSSMIGRRVLRVEDRRFLLVSGKYVEGLELSERAPPHVRPLAVPACADPGRRRVGRLALPGIQVFTAADIDLTVFPPPPIPFIDNG